jgi:hypothetical protein
VTGIHDENAGEDPAVERLWWFIPALAAVAIGGVLGAVLVPMPPPQPQPASLFATPSCGPEASARDADGKLIGATQNTTTIRVKAPQLIRAGVESTFEWYMEGPTNAELVVYAENPLRPLQAFGRYYRVDPTAVHLVAKDTWAVRMTIPTAGCWHFQTQRGVLYGDLWVTVAAPTS